MSEQPQWMRRPSGPGKWVCKSDQSGRDLGFHQTVLDLDAWAIEEGAPFHTEWVYGPIPSPPQEPKS